MNLGRVGIAIAISATALVGCGTIAGTFGGAKKDFSAAVTYGKNALSYDPTNGTVAQIDPEIFGPVKVYSPVPQTEK